VRTLTSEDIEHFHENGRTYANETYYLPCVYMPNDDFQEQDRLSLQHQIFAHALKGKLTTTRLLPSTRRVLDLGTGPGHWACGMAKQFPQVQVVGIDLSEWDLNTTEATVGESRVLWELDDLDIWGQGSDINDLAATLAQYDFFTEPSNRTPIGSPVRPASQAGLEHIAMPPAPSTGSSKIDLSTLQSDPEPGWHFSEPYDLIHLRNMKGVFAHWEEVYAEVYKSLSRGGWIEVADYDLGQVPMPLENAESTDLPLPTLRRLYASLMEASFKSGRPLGTFYMHPSYLEEAGFVDVKTTQVNIPVGQWPEDEEQKSLGKLMLVLVMETLEISLLRLLTKYGDQRKVWTIEEIQSDVMIAKEEVADWSARAASGEVEGWCASFKWITGRKSWHES
jgi:SAM-dependent methyltransferase